MDEISKGQAQAPALGDNAALSGSTPALDTDLPQDSMSPESDATPPPTDSLADPGALAAADASASGLDPVTLTDQLAGFLQVGGPVVWILLGFSVIALSIALLKLWQFARLRPESHRELDRSLEFWRNGQTTRALEVLNDRRPAAELVALAIRGLSDDSRDSSLLKDELERVATLRLNQLRSFLRPLEVIATLSPLLGLLGTVLGMIVAFQQMEAAGNQVDPSVLSGGIWQALLTTAVGLAVAIPVLTAHHWLERKTERAAALMSDAVTRVFTCRPGKPKLAETSEPSRHAA
ncbi:hypothetical protein GCM10011348_31950 [Marinobacterium nitratireducens]|uniref:MotA/TolQ/ExbB proton channel domain-containing protein n=1 Tax=Marinobacterium nitratireducens TaxID=518897 RepID=A0A918DWG3_9GAMM|nr:MotA/TolQ/ExbB proton channel family protein [Marinobacterium nitratireducens]GGO84827.1 hypothetical protein GCM10011348_31950 [Marinobacterium nitratireducens]